MSDISYCFFLNRLQISQYQLTYLNLMKIKLTAIFLAIFALTSSTAFAEAKAEKKESLKVKQYKKTSEKKDPADDLKIQPFDFQNYSRKQKLISRLQKLGKN